MGAGHSKSFRRSKKGAPYPDGMPVPQPYQPQNPFVPPNYQMPYPPPGYPAQQQGFVPQGYGIQQPPQNMLNWMPDDRDRQKSRRSRRARGRSEDYASGHRGQRWEDEDRAYFLFGVVPTLTTTIQGIAVRRANLGGLVSPVPHQLFRDHNVSAFVAKGVTLTLRL